MLAHSGISQVTRTLSLDATKNQYAPSIYAAMAPEHTCGDLILPPDWSVYESNICISPMAPVRGKWWHLPIFEDTNYSRLAVPKTPFLCRPTELLMVSEMTQFVKIVKMKIWQKSQNVCELTGENLRHLPARRRGETSSPRRSGHPCSDGAGATPPPQSCRESVTKVAQCQCRRTTMGPFWIRRALSVLRPFPLAVFFSLC